jgi:ankyrin repeat protein
VLDVLICFCVTGSPGSTEDSALVVRNLLLAGARPDERDATRRTPLHAAATTGHSAAALALLQNGADPDATDADHNNPLHLAAKASHLQVKCYIVI